MRSIQAQTHRKWRCHLHDDASVDIDAVQRIADTDDRLTLYSHKERLGVVGNAARAIGMLPDDAEIVFFADQDDLWEPAKIDRVCQAFVDNPDWQLVHSDMALIDRDDRVLEPSAFAHLHRETCDFGPEALLVRSTVTGCSMAVRAGLLKRAMPLPTAASPTVYHDRWLAMIAALDGPIGYLDEPLTRYRQHGANQVGAVSPVDRGRQVRREPVRLLSDAWAERRAVLDALESWARTADLSPDAKRRLAKLLTWRGRWHSDLWRYGLTLRPRSWVDRRAALGLAVARLFQSQMKGTG
ncbi:MAG: glycosyltransferase [Pseudomonadota bacterium]